MVTGQRKVQENQGIQEEGIIFCNIDTGRRKRPNGLHNSFIIMLQVMLYMVKSLVNFKKDIKAIEAKLSKIKIQGTLNNAAMKSLQM